MVSRAGFKGESVAEAAAIALHQTGGADDYDHLACVDPLIHYRGLFALSAAPYKLEDRHLLYDPMYSARELHKLYRANGSTFNGHPAYDQALQASFIKEVKAALRSRTPTSPLEAPNKLAQVAYTNRLHTS